MEVRLYDKPVCDFCSSDEPRWLFRARNYRMQDIVPGVTRVLPPQDSQGGWLACHACAPFVQRNDWNGLARRVTAMGGINPLTRYALTGLDLDTVVGGLKRAWKQFAENRVGGAMEWRPQ